MRLGPLWGKKDKHCDVNDPGDREQGSYWDHVLIDADSRLIVTLVIGRRETETARQAFADFYSRTDGDLTPLITSDEYAPYLSVIVQTYGVAKEDLELTPEQKAQYDYESLPEVYFPVEMAYATVPKEREGGHVVGGGAACGAGDRATGGRGVGPRLDIEDSQHQLRGAVSRDAAALQRPQGPEGLYVLQGVGVACGGDVAVRDVLQLRLDAPDVAGARARGTASVSRPNAGDGGGPNRSSMVDGRYTHLPLVPIQPTA
jgi:hypothetical protein